VVADGVTDVLVVPVTTPTPWSIESDVTVPVTVHARVELRRGKFVLVDQSTNGTYLTTSAIKDVHLHMDELPLEGHGVIMLGKRPDKDAKEKIVFAVRATSS